MEIIEKLVEEFKIKKKHAENIVKLLDEGSTVPFIARYRKEMTGAMTDENLRLFKERLDYLRGFYARKESILKLIEEKGALTDELIQSIFLAESKEELEDIYKPFKENRKTRKSAAIDLGFENARNLVYENKSQEEIIEECLKTASENDLTLEEGLNFVTDIIRGDISEDFSIKKYIRDRAMYTGLVVSEKNKDTENFTYESYYDFKSKIRSIKAHQVLALKRGEKEEALKVDLKLEDDANLDYIRGKYIVDKNDFNREIIEKALIDSYKTLILPSIKNEIWSILKEEADKKSILIFKENLKPYLMQRPLKKRAVIGLDPGFRTGCKVAVISCYGDYLDSAVIHVTEPKKTLIRLWR